MRILQVISSGGMYGAEAVILDLSRCFREAGHDALIGVFANSTAPNTELQERAQNEGIEVHVLPCTGQLDLSVLSRLRRLVQSAQIDVVHAHGYKADVYVFLALRNASVPIVATCHTWYDNDLQLRLYGMLDRLVLRSFGGIAAVSEAVRRRLLGAGVRADRIRLIRNGVNDSSLKKIDRSNKDPGDRCLRVGLVRRLAPEKGVDVFFRAAALVLLEEPRTEFVVAGDGPDRATLESLLLSLHLGDSVALLGRTENMQGFYESLDLLVSASRNEGMPIALLEGMASGLAIVATRAGEIPKVVDDQVTGTLVDVEDPAALSAAIVGLLRDPDRRRSMEVQARRRIANEFSAERMAAEYLNFYASVRGDMPSGQIAPGSSN